MSKRSGRNSDLFAATHEAILGAATLLFAAEGFDAVKTEAIAREAGVSHGSLFHHFRSKRDLFIAVHNRFQIELVGRIDAAAAAATSVEDRFDRIWRAYLASTDEASMRRILLLDGPRVIGLEALRAQDRDTAFAFFMAELGALEAEGLLRPVSLRALAVLLFGALDQAAFEIADFPDDAELKRALFEQAAELVERLKRPVRSP